MIPIGLYSIFIMFFNTYDYQRNPEIANVGKVYIGVSPYSFA